MNVKDLAETQVERLLRQRDQAWRTLAKVENALGTASESGLAFILAGSHGMGDAKEYYEVVTTEPEEPEEIDEPY